MTTAVFHYADPATLSDSSEPFVKPWSKVDTDVSTFSRIAAERPVIDIQTAPGPFGVDVTGFALYDAPAQEKDFTDDDAVRQGYYAEVERLLRDKLSTPAEPVRQVVIFDHTIRRRDPQAPRQPVQQVHVDQTPRAAAKRVQRHTDARVTDDWLQGRYQLINVWRPIGHAATDAPLALVDWRTTDPEDVRAVDLLYPEQAKADVDDCGKEVLPDPAKALSTDGYSITGETYTVVPNEKHKFYYAKNMTPDQALFIKCFDSRSAAVPGGRPHVAAWTPHTAFTDPATPPDAPFRQSIEVRCLVLYGKGE